MTLKEFLHKPFMKRIIRLVCLTFAGVIVAHLILKQDRIYWQDMTFHAMSTYVTYRVYLHNTESSAPVFRIVNEAFREINQRCNRFDPESEIARLNAAAYQKPFSCSPELWELLCKAREMYQLSGGAFDISVGPLTKIWKNCQMKTLPTESEIAAARAKVGLDKVIFDDATRTVRFTVGGMSLDLGGIAKGAALDLAGSRLEVSTAVGDSLRKDVSLMDYLEAVFRNTATDLNCGFINAGGNVLALSEPPPKEKSYRVGIQNPVDPRGNPCAFAEMLAESVSTSGNYQRYITVNGKNYTHIIDPVTGYPVENMLSVTVVTKYAVDADVLSTAIFIKGKDFARKMKEKYPDLRVLMFYLEPGDTTRKVQVFSIGKWDDLTVPELPEQKQ